MSSRNDIFYFKQFSVKNSISGMKVGTDGVLIGAWSNCGGPNANILDIGSGSGLIALMMAQRNLSAHVTGVEIEPQACAEAQFNIGNSPWTDRIEIINSNIFIFSPSRRFDIIVSNPPFFSNSLLCPDSKRTLARHTQSLPLPELLLKVKSLLAPHGSFNFIFPSTDFQRLLRTLHSAELHLTRLCQVFPTVNHTESKRVMIECTHLTPGNSLQPPITEDLHIERSRHIYTDAYRTLTHDFYLNL